MSWMLTYHWTWAIEFQGIFFFLDGSEGYWLAHQSVVECVSKGAFTLIRIRVLHRVRVLHEKADGSGRHVKSMDFIEIADADADADEGRGRGRGPV